MIKELDSRTGLTRMIFNGDSWLKTNTEFSCPFTVVVYAEWNERRSWSRIIDFGFGPANNNIVVAN